MKYKNHVLDLMENASSSIAKIEIAVGRGDRETAYKFIEEAKERLESVRDMLRNEDDGFENQFRS